MLNTREMQVQVLIHEKLTAKQVNLKLNERENRFK